MIHLSQAAANEIRRLQSSCQKLDSHFRIGVKTGGCSGLFYTFELNEAIKPSDRVGESNGIFVVVDEQSYPCLKGLKLDYSEDLMGGCFRFHNPNASATCGCGQSFSVES
ncbi:MAG: HesB/IscA family protein [Xenococcaceae cyanobacterium]